MHCPGLQYSTVGRRRWKATNEPGFDGVGLLSPIAMQGCRRLSSSKQTCATKQDPISKLKNKVEERAGV